MSQGTKLSYNLGYLITAAIFFHIRTVLTDIIRICWIYTLHRYYPHHMVVSIFHVYYIHIVYIVDISAFRGYYL